MNDGWVYTDRVKKSAIGLSVLQYYVRKYSHSSKDRWRRRIKAGQILLDGKAIAPNTLLKAGQKLTYHRPPWQEPEVPLDFEIIYEDEDIVIANKPSGLPVLPGGGFLQHTLLYRLQKLYPQDTPVPIHRLGRGTSGLILLARSKIAKSRLSQQMRDRKIKKVYLAKASGIITQDKFTISDRIGKIPHPILGYIYGTTPSGKYACSHCKVIKRDLDNTIVEVTISTGRPHQIRIHLAAASYPLTGDPLYLRGGIPRYSDLDSSDIVKDKIVTPGDLGYSLHAYQLSFQHPISDLQVSFTCTPPQELTNTKK